MTNSSLENQLLIKPGQRVAIINPPELMMAVARNMMVMK